MPPKNLEGVNITHCDLLKLWTNLAFNSDESVSPIDEERTIMEKKEEEGSGSEEKALHDGHAMNVVTPAVVPAIPNPSLSVTTQSAGLFNIGVLLNVLSMGIDAFPAQTSQQQQQPTTIPPYLAQLLFLHPSYIPASDAGFPQYMIDLAAPLPSSRTTSILSDKTDAPMAKCARAGGVSLTSAESPDCGEENILSLNPSPNLSPVEDKRRRNVAASARFRLKKKKQEAILEGKVKELEIKAKELERVCKDLRIENGWLRGIVVCVTGAGQIPPGLTVAVSSPPPDLLPLTITIPADIL